MPPGEQLVELLRAALATLDERLPPPRPLEALPLLSRAVIPLKDYAQPELWQEAGALLHELLRGPLDFLLRRLEGNYITDAYGTDPEIIELFRPLLEFMYYRWWRVTTEGLDYVPAQGRALLVSNHSGVLPWDGAMIAASLYLHHSPRLVRNLFLDWFSKIPVLAPGFTALGQLSGLHRNATHLLEAEELLCTFPEGVKGIGKPFKDRYRLARFGRGGYVQIALRTGTPIIPVAVFGAEEIYPLMGSIDPLARLLGMPYFPVTPFFPWLGLLGAMPLPVKWSITFCPPIDTQQYGPQAADDPLIVFMLNEQVRHTIQRVLNEKLAARRSLFW
ncbi:MAG: acyltransferase family protein [Chloroflexaceae bacterium]|nr:acyltransferase family protein [Chloroflexaceae bacterium]